MWLMAAWRGTFLAISEQATSSTIAHLDITSISTFTRAMVTTLWWASQPLADTSLLPALLSQVLGKWHSAHSQALADGKDWPGQATAEEQESPFQVWGCKHPVSSRLPDLVQDTKSSYGKKKPRWYSRTNVTLLLGSVEKLVLIPKYMLGIVRLMGILLKAAAICCHVLFCLSFLREKRHIYVLSQN